jgi:multidrug efflux system membrane fusion protein
MKIHHLIFAGTLSVALCIIGCSPKDNAAGKTAPAVPVLAVPATAKNVPTEIRAIGNVTPISKVTVRSQITGKLTAVNFKEGQTVKAGDLLFTIDSRPWQAALARDKAQFENSQVQFEREQKLFDQKIASQDEYDTSKAARDTLAATVQTDELNLEYCEIRSPVDGVTGSQQVFAGNIVKSPDDVMVTINQIHPIYVAFAVPEQNLPQIKSEMSARTLKATASFTGMSGDAPQGEVTFVDNSVDPTTGTIQLKATFANDDAKLWPGQFVQTTLTLSEITNAVVVPSQAIQTGQNGQFVFVVKADQNVELRPVTPGDTLHGETVVASGLQPGEVVVTDGQLRLTPGAKVAVKASLTGNTDTNAPALP